MRSMEFEPHDNYVRFRDKFGGSKEMTMMVSVLWKHSGYVILMALC